MANSDSGNYELTKASLEEIEQLNGLAIEDMQSLSDYYVSVVKNTLHKRIARHIVQFPTRTRRAKACHLPYLLVAHHHNSEPLICIRRSWFYSANDREKLDILAHELAHIYAHTHKSKKFNDAYHFALILLSSYLG